MDYPVRLTDPGSLLKRVTDALREAIVSGRLKPGERLRERELVAFLGISRSPLREAIRILESEGLVTSLPNRGSRVTELTATDLRETNDVRIMLETFAVRLALGRGEDGMVAALASRLEAARQAGPDLGGGDDFTIALGFHDVLVHACGNSKVIQLYEMLKAHLRRYHHFAVTRIGRDWRSIEEHAAILEAVQRRDLPEFERILTAHLRRASEEIALLLPAARPSAPPTGRTP
jgi:DNA-binding GntR family transcriptional regulator